MRRRILVIDDEEGVRDAFELALDETRYEVVTAADGLEGLERAAEATPDLVILDLKMPHLDGVETLRRLRVQCPGVSVYILTAFYEEYLRPLAGLSAEGAEFELVRKPLDADQIRGVIAAALGGGIAETPDSGDQA